MRRRLTARLVALALMAGALTFAGSPAPASADPPCRSYWYTNYSIATLTAKMYYVNCTYYGFNIAGVWEDNTTTTCAWVPPKARHVYIGKRVALREHFIVRTLTCV